MGFDDEDVFLVRLVSLRQMVGTSREDEDKLGWLAWPQPVTTHRRHNYLDLFGMFDVVLMLNVENEGWCFLMLSTLHISDFVNLMIEDL